MGIRRLHSVPAVEHLNRARDTERCWQLLSSCCKGPDVLLKITSAKGITFRSQPGQELLAPLLIPMASVGLTKPSIPRSASIVPRKPPLGSGVSDSCWLSSSSPPPPPPPGLELWTTNRYTAQRERTLLCSKKDLQSYSPGDPRRASWSHMM